MPPAKVTRIGAISASPLELSVELHTQEQKLELSFTTEIASQLVGYLNALSAKVAGFRKSASGGTTEILSSIRAVGFRANASQESQLIILSFYNASGLEFNFTIASDLSDRVCSEIQKAAKQSELSQPLRKQ